MMDNYGVSHVMMLQWQNHILLSYDLVKQTGRDRIVGRMVPPGGTGAKIHNISDGLENKNRQCVAENV